MAKGFVSRNFVLIFLASCLFYGSNFYFVAVLPTVLDRAGYSGTQIGLVVGSFSLTAIFLRPYFGTLSDRFPRKTFMVAGTAIFTLVPLLYSTSTPLGFLILLRIVHGLGLAAYGTSSIVTITEIVPRERLAQAVGIYATCFSVAMGIGPAAGLKLAGLLPFQQVILIPCLASALALLLVSSMIRVSRPDHGEETKPFWMVLSNRDVLLPSVLFACCSCTVGGVIAFLPLYTATFHISTTASVFYVTFSVIIILVRLTIGGLSDSVGRVKVIVPAVLFVIIGVASLAAAGGPWALALIAAVYGAGYSLAYPTLNAFVVDHAPRGSRGAALGIFSASVDTGYFLGPIMAGLLIDYLSFRGTFFVLSLLPLVALGCFLFCPPAEYTKNRCSNSP